MTSNATATYPRELASAGSASAALSLVDEHAVLLHGVHRRVWPVLALIDAGAWPTAELTTLVGFLRASLFRQTSDEEALLFSGCEGTPFAELTVQHARLHALTERLAHANVTHCALPELRRVVAELVNVLARHLETEQALLAGLAEMSQPVPGAAELASGKGTWLAANEASLLIVLDQFPQDVAAQLCIERLLRLRPGQTAEIRSSDDSELAHIYRWMRAFDTASYCIEYVSANTPEAHLQVRRRNAGPK